jgi:hypothetical protein
VEQFRGGFPTKREAEHALQELTTSLRGGTYVERSNVTLGEYLRGEWLEATAPPRVKYETWDDRRRSLEVHVIPRIGGIPIQDLNAAHVNKLYSDLLRDGLVDGSGACLQRQCAASIRCCARPSMTRSQPGWPHRQHPPDRRRHRGWLPTARGPEDTPVGANDPP